MNPATTPASASHGAIAFEGSAYTNAAPSGRLMTAVELAERWQVRPAQVYRLTREGCLSTVRIGRYYRYSESAIAAFEAAGGVAADV